MTKWPPKGCLAYRDLDDGRSIVVYRMMPGQLRLTIGPKGEGWFDDFWCYHDINDVAFACAHWDGHGDPPGKWYRNGSTARRRRFDGDGNVVEEYIQM